MLATFLLALTLSQDADLLQRLQPVVERAGDLDPQVRAAAIAEASRIADAQEEPLDALARQRKPAALAVLALAGRQDPAAALRSSDRAARRAVCDVLIPAKDQIPDLLRLLDAKDLATRILACRALGRVEDPQQREKISSALGHGMRRTAGADLLFALVSAGWHGFSNPYLFFMTDAEPDRATLAVAALCNLQGLTVHESLAPLLSRTLEYEKLDRPLRSLLIRVLGRRSPATFLPLLSLRDAKFRAEMIEVLDQFLTDPLASPAVLEAWRDAKAKKTDDGRTPALPVTTWTEAWLKRLCGGGVTPETFPAWHRANYRIAVDRQADAAVKRGVAGLQSLLSREAAWRTMPGGAVAGGSLAAYALLKSGVPAEDPVVARALDAVLDRDPEGIYGTSLAAMALATAIEKGTPKRERMQRRLQRMADVLVASQMKSGGWSYVACHGPDQTTKGWIYDLSNTQFAILGLRAAANAGSKIPRTTWERALALLDKVQLPDGGWSYHGTQSGGTPSMTAAGAYSWLICRLSLDDGFAPREAVENSRIREAVAGLAQSVDLDAAIGRVDYYRLYSVERFCMIAGLEKLGLRDWYADGASQLTRAQGSDGLWSGIHGSIIDTSFALLFLRRAFIARPDIATESAQRRATEEQAREAFERRCEALFVDGVRDVRVNRDADTWFLEVVVDSEQTAIPVTVAVGREIDGVPIRVVVE